MIPVAPATEPPTFDAKVRQPGLNALAELVGESSPVRTGPKRKKIAERREDLRWDDFHPYWREALPDLLTAYKRICAYTCLYIHPVTGAQSVDHMAAKSSEWHHVYEWSNYRLACARVNSGKGVKSPLDPFEIGDDWFELELVGYQLLPGASVQEPLRTKILATIFDLDLNHPDHCLARSEYAEDYLEHGLSFGRLERRAPFVARELRRQGKLHLTDQVPPT